MLKSFKLCKSACITRIFFFILREREKKDLIGKAEKQ